MTSLTQTAYYSRKIIKYGSIGLAALLILRSVFIGVSTYLTARYPKKNPPTVGFGKLPSLSFPPRTNLPPIGLKLETISGALPALAEQAKVFFVPQSSPSLSAWDNTKIWARGLGFSSQPQEIDKFSYRFTTDTTPKTTLEVNVVTKNFHLVYDWRNDLRILGQEAPPKENEAISLAKSFLQGAEVLTPDLAGGTAETIYFKYKNGNLITALFPNEANFVKVNLFRQNLDTLRIMPPDPADSNISVLISNPQDRNRNVLEVKYTYFPVSERMETYPLKDVNLAWKQLAAGKGFIASLGNNPEGKITIRNAFLAYYESSTIQTYLQPIFVFEGDNGFYAYVPAINDSWMEQPPAS